MNPRNAAWSLLAGLLGLLLGASLPQRPGPAPERRADVPGCDGRAAWRLAAVEALFTGLPRRPDRDAGPLGRALCALPDQPPAEPEVQAIAANPRAHQPLGLRIHAAWTAYAGEQPPVPPDVLHMLRRSGIDVRAFASCVRQVEWLLTDLPFGTDPIASAPNATVARRAAVARAFAARTVNNDALAVCQAAFKAA
jgi:hypothetical protein